MLLLSGGKAWVVTFDKIYGGNNLLSLAVVAIEEAAGRPFFILEKYFFKRASAVRFPVDFLNEIYTFPWIFLFDF